MCLDLRNGNFKDIKQVEYVLKYVPKTTDEQLIKANKDKKIFKALIKDAQLNEEFELIYG